MRPALRVLLVLALLVAAPATAQVGSGRADAGFEDDSIEVPSRTVGMATIVLTNYGLQPASFTLKVLDPGPAIATLNMTEALVLPGSRQDVGLEVVPPARAPIGRFTIKVAVNETGTALSPGGSRILSLDVTIVPQAPPPGTPLLDVDVLSVAARANSTVEASLDVHHDAATNQSYRVRAFLPVGWSISASALVVPPDQTRALHLNVSASHLAQNGTGRLVVEDASGATLGSVADVDLRILAALPPPQNVTRDPPPRNDTQPPREGNATRDPPQADPADADDASAEAPGTDQTLQPAAAGPSEERSNATAPEREPATPPPSSPAPPPRVFVFVDPSLVILAPGGVTTARLTAEAEDDVQIVLRAILPEGIGSTMTEVKLDLRANEPYSLLLHLEADPLLENGTRLVASIETLDQRVQAPFQILIEHPAPPVEVTSLSAPDDPAVGGETVLAITGLAAFAAGVGMSAMALVWTRKKWALALAGLYARIRPRAVMEHPMRERMARVVHERPGLTIRELQRELDLANGAMTHHLRTLEKAALLRVVSDGMLRRVYPAGHARVEPVPPLADRVLEVLQARGETTPSQIAEALGVSRQSVHYHLQKMVREGKLRARVHGQETFLRLAEPGAA